MKDESTLLRRRSVMLILLEDDDDNDVFIFRFRYVTFDVDLLICCCSKFCGSLRIVVDKSRRDIDRTVVCFRFCCFGLVG